MKFYILSFLLFFHFTSTNAQWNAQEKSELQPRQHAQFLFDQKLYSLCQSYCNPYFNKYILNKESQSNVGNFDLVYYYIASGLNTKQANIESITNSFISHKATPTYYAQKTSLLLGQYYFDNSQYSKALPYLVNSGFNHLTSDEIAQKKFCIGYCYMVQKDFDQAYAEFSSIKNANAKYINDANYYFGLLAFGKGQYKSALESFRYIEADPKYKTIVPYYVAETYYHQKKLDDCILYIQRFLKHDSLQKRGEMQSLLAQCYFEKKDYLATIQALGQAQKNGLTISDNQIYNLGYAYYTQGKIDSTIQLFKPLAEKKDSLGQNAMYLLADCFLQKDDLNQAKNAFYYCKNLNYNSSITENSLFNYIKICYLTNQYHEALRNLETFNDKYPNSKFKMEGQTMSGQMYLQTNNYAKGWIQLSKDSATSNIEMQKVLQTIAYQYGKELLNANELDKSYTYLLYATNHNADSKIGNLAQLWLGEINVRNAKYNDGLQYSLNYIKSQDAPNSDNTLIAKYNAGFCYLKNENPDLAILLFEQLYNNTSSTELGKSMVKLASAKLADAHFMKNNYSKAHEFYTIAKSNNTSDKYYLEYQEAQLMGLKENQKNQIIALAKISDNINHPYQKQATFELAELYFINEDFKSAEKNYLKSIALNHNKSKSYYKIALGAESTNNKEKAISLYKKIILEYPSSEEKNLALVQLESQAIKNNDVDKLNQFLSDSVSLQMNKSKLDSLSYISAESSFSSNNNKQAIQSFSNYLSKFPNGIFKDNAVYYLAQSHLKTKQYKQVVQVLNDNPISSQSEYYDLALELKSDVALQNLHDTLLAANTYQTLQHNTSNPLLINKSTEFLINYYYPKNSDSLTSIVNYYQTIAEKTELPNEQLNISLWQGMSQLANKNYAASYTTFDKIITDKAPNPYIDQAIYYKGKLLMQENKLADAEKYMLEAISLNNITEYWNLKYYLLLADIFILEGDKFNAKSTLQSLVENAKDVTIRNEASIKLKSIK